MKKLFITLAFVAAAFFAQAQLFVGGSLGFTNTKDPLDKPGTEKITKIDVLPTEVTCSQTTWVLVLISV